MAEIAARPISPRVLLPASWGLARSGRTCGYGRSPCSRPAIRRREPARGRNVGAARANVEDGDGDDVGDAGGDPLDNPLFNDDFKAAFLAAQERIAEREAPLKAQINEEVAEIMKQVNAERAAAAGEDAEAKAEAEVNERRVPAEEKVEGGELAEQWAAPLDNPLFNDDFKAAFLAAQERIAEREAPMKAKINEEVAEIMKQVNAERDAAARGEPMPTDPIASRPPSAAGDVFDAMTGVGATLDDLGAAFAATPPINPVAASSAVSGLDASALDVDILVQMRKTAEDSLRGLTNTLGVIENAAKAQRMQIERLDYLLEKARKEARYREAERMVQERKRAEDSGQEKR